MNCSYLLLFIGTLNNTHFENFNMCLQVFIHAFRHFQWPGGRGQWPCLFRGPHQVQGNFCDPEILYIICGTCCTSQGDPDSCFPYGVKPYQSKCLFLTSGGLFLTSKCLFLTSECLFLMSESLFLTSECLFLTSESPFIWVHNQTLPTKPNLSESLFPMSECLFPTRR